MTAALARKPDMIDHPAHYVTAAGIEAIDVIERYTLDSSMHIATAAKYLMRAGRKGDRLEDLRKCDWYLRRWIVWKSRNGVRPAPLSHGRAWKKPDEILEAFELTGTHQGDALRSLLMAVELGAPGRVEQASASVRRAIAELEADQQTITIPWRDPRWSAWICYWLADRLMSERARRMRDMRWDVQVPANWPPASMEVQALSRSSWSIPHGTPEHAAHCASMRRTNPDLAQSWEFSKTTLLKPSRWPEI